MTRIAKKAGAYHHGNLRSVLLETAARVIEKDGVAAVSLHALTRRAGVSSGAAYHHFASREQLLAAVAAEGSALLVTEMRRVVDGLEQDPLAYLEGLGRAYVQFAVAHRGHFRVMFRSELRAHLTKAERATADEELSLLQQAIIRCQQAGLIARGNVASLALLAWSTVHGASELWIEGSLGDKGLVPDEQALATTIAASFVRLLTGQLRP
ncbi:MAG TPA: TetR/AcrR family transcriptional regulator [Polyangiaceae bacterium]